MTDTTTSPILYVYEGKFGLPSIDPKCLQLLFYLRLHPNHNIRIKTPGTWASPLLPALRYGSRLIIEFNEIVETLMRLVEPTCDENFDEVTRRSIGEYKKLNFELLEPIFVLNFWGYMKNLDYFGDLYSNPIHPSLRQNFRKTVRIYHMEHILRILNDHSFTDCVVLGNVTVERYIHFVSVLLGNKRFLFGDSPSTYDAHLCGYLAPLITYKFPNNQLKKILYKHAKVVNYVNNYVEIYGDRRHDATDVDDFGQDRPRNYRKIWCFLTSVFVALVSFGIYKYRGY